MPWNLVPQIFFDFIARISPGAGILVLGVFTMLGPSKTISKVKIAFSMQLNFTFGMFFIGIILSYILGFVLRGLWETMCKHIHDEWSKKEHTLLRLTEKSLRDLNIQSPNDIWEALLPITHQDFLEKRAFLQMIKRQMNDKSLFAQYKNIILEHADQYWKDPLEMSLKHHNKLRKVLGKDALTVTRDNLPPYHIMRNHLRHLSEDQVHRLLKLRAEEHLNQSLFIGAIACSLLNIICGLYQQNFLGVERILLTIFLILILYSSWYQIDRFGRYFIHGICTQWLLFSFPPKEKDTPNSHLGRK